MPGVSLRFGSDSSGLTSAQLSLITAEGFINFTLDNNGYLTAEAQSPFESWICGSFSGGFIPAERQGPNDDFDDDGVPNLLEYALAGQDPTLANPRVGSFDGVSLSFSKRPDAGGISYAVEMSTDLDQTDPWDEVSGDSYVNDSDTISFVLPTGQPRIFLRLRVTAN